MGVDTEFMRMRVRSTLGICPRVAGLALLVFELSLHLLARFAGQRDYQKGRYGPGRVDFGG